MPSGGIGYPNPARYWGFLRMTLVEVFSFTATEADTLVGDLQSDLSTASADEQLFFFHYEPLEVALKVTDLPLTFDTPSKYAKALGQFAGDLRHG